MMMRQPDAPHRLASLKAPIAGISRRMLSVASSFKPRKGENSNDPKDAPPKIYPSRILHRLASGLMGTPVMAAPTAPFKAAGPKGDHDEHQADFSDDAADQETLKSGWLGRLRHKRRNDKNDNAFGTTFKINVAPRRPSDNDDAPSCQIQKVYGKRSSATSPEDTAVSQSGPDGEKPDSKNPTEKPDSIMSTNDKNGRARGPTFLPNLKRSSAEMTNKTARSVPSAQDDGVAGVFEDETNEIQEATRFPKIAQASASPAEVMRQGRSEREMQLIEKAPPKVLKIGTKKKPRNVSDKELGRLRVHFSKHDRGDGVAPHGELIAAAGGTGKASSTTLLASNKVKMRMRRRSTADRVADGFLNFLDFLRLNYPEATQEDIVIMNKIAREMAGEKLFSRQYPRYRQDAAAKQWNSLSAGRELVFLGDLEDFLIQKFQHGDHYQMLKAVSTPLNDMYKAGAGIDKEDFMFWMLQLEDEWN